MNYTFDPSNRLTNVAQQSPGTLAAGAVAFDAADRPTCVPLPNHVFATYSYDADSRATAINYGYSTTATCTSPPTNLGNLTYTYDPDSRIVALGGSLAALNLPPATSHTAAYNTRNQLTSWNGINVSNNDRGDLTTDPARKGAIRAASEMSGRRMLLLTVPRHEMRDRSHKCCRNLRRDSN